MTLKWTGVAPEWMNRVLSLYRDSTWFVHSDHILAHSLDILYFEHQSEKPNLIGWQKWHSDGWNDDVIVGISAGVREWWLNETDFKIKGFGLLPKIHLISPSFRQSGTILESKNCSECSLDEWTDIEMIYHHCIFHSSTFLASRNGKGMTERGGMKVV